GAQTLTVVFTPDKPADLATITTSVTLTVMKAGQTINFEAIPDHAAGDPPFTAQAAASSKLPVVFSVVSGPATVSGNTVTITRAGKVTIQASQSGNNNYLAANGVTRTFTV